MSDREALLPVVGKYVEHRKRRFYVHSKIYQGPFSEVYIVTEGGQRYAMKTEKVHGATRRILKLDVLVLSQINRNEASEGFPHVIIAGRTPFYKYCVMQLVGPDLGRLRRALPNKRLSLASALRISIQTLNRLETLHDNGWLCRDVKANNYAVGRGKNASIIYMFDFGFARRYVDENGNLLEQGRSSDLVGTILYAPLSAHNFTEQCRRDDLESWLYMTIETISGSLPWSSLNPKTEYMLIGEWKRFARYSGRWELFRGCPKEFDEILKSIDGIGFNTRPDYRLIRTYIEDAMTRLKISCSEPFEWEQDRLILRKASVMGDRGESDLATSKLQKLEAAAAFNDEEYNIDTTL
uniref:Protein kinase domain-containing protein n=1 Tax=Parascaris univalens TaxID=6257 RepID=A0A915AY04_PARUN